MGSIEFDIQRLTTLDGVEALAETARPEGFRMVDRLRQEWADGTQRFDQPGEQLFGAYVSGQLLGIGGVTRQDATTGRVRRVYVLPDFRRHGIATSLLGKILEVSRPHYVKIVLHTDIPNAARFYETNGFLREVVGGPGEVTHSMNFSGG